MHVYDYDNIYQVTDVNYPEDFDYLATDTAFDYDPVGAIRDSHLFFVDARSARP